MLIGLVKDESARFDGYNWHDEYACFFSELGCSTKFLDFKKNHWEEEVENAPYDALLWRAWHRPTDRDNAKNKIYYLDRIRGIRIFPDWNMYWSYDNKIRQLLLLRQHGISHPPTFVSYDLEESLQFAETAPLPIISKCTEGACGDNVQLLSTRSELEHHIHEIFNPEGIPTYFPTIRQQGYVYLQHYYPTARDLRIITVGSDIAVAFWREGEGWKHNISKGAQINTHNIPAKALDCASEFAHQLGFHWCAFDLLAHQDNLYVLEFSAIFGFSSPEQYIHHFGSPHAGVLQKQAQYIVHHLGITK